MLVTFGMDTLAFPAIPIPNNDSIILTFFVILLFLLALFFIGFLFEKKFLGSKQGDKERLLQITKGEGNEAMGIEAKEGKSEQHILIGTSDLDQRTQEMETQNMAMVNKLEDLQNANQLSEINARRLAEVNAELEAFSYSVSHDLRAPLRAVSGFSQILNRRYHDILDEDGQRYLDNILQASDYMGKLIDDLLAYSRLGRKAIRLKPVALYEVMQLVIESLSDLIEESQAEIYLPNKLPDVMGDKTLLTKVFFNLIQNGLIYHSQERDPIIRITWENLDKSDITGEKKMIKVMINDNGIGIPAFLQGKIFNVFQRLQTQEDYPGTGIGLSIVKKSLMLMNGDVKLVSEVDQGSTFTVYLLGCDENRLK